MKPQIIDAPRAIFLVYGDIDFGCSHRDCIEVSWCEDPQYPSDVRYIRASPEDIVAWKYKILPHGDYMEVTGVVISKTELWANPAIPRDRIVWEPLYA